MPVRFLSDAQREQLPGFPAELVGGGLAWVPCGSTGSSISD